MDIIKVAKNLFFNKINENKAIASVNGEIKIISCEMNILLEFIQFSDGKTLDEVIDFFSNRFEKQEIIDFTLTLVKENIISFSNKEMKENTLKKVSVIYKGNLYSNIKELINDDIQIHEEAEIKELDHISIDSDFVIAVLDNANYGDLIDINRILYEKRKPYLFIYYNGEGVVCGPFVIPGKTACLECLLTHRIKKLNNNTNDEITFNSIRSLTLSKLIDNKNYDETFYNNIARIVKLELKKINEIDTKFNFVNTEYVFSERSMSYEFKREFTPISSCNCCHAHNINYIELDEMKHSDLTTREEKKSNEIRYSTGGLRSLSASQTKEIVDKALEKSGLKIEIKLAVDNPFSEIIPVFDSSLEKTHNNKTPYLLYSQLSHGKGINKQQAYFSAAFEIFERISARYFGEKQIISAKYKDVSDIAINIGDMMDNIVNKNTEFDVFSDDIDIDWVVGNSLITNEPRLIPASMAFLSSTYFKGNFTPASSTGLAAGGTIKDAILQGIYEILEHDAWMIGQANAIKLPIVDIRTSENEQLKNKIKGIEKLGYNVIIRDYSNDIGIPVFRAWIVSKDNYTNYAFNGFGASFDPEISLERAVTEAVQSANKKATIRSKKLKKPSAGYMMNDPNTIYNLGYFINKDIKIDNEENIVSIKKYKKPCLKSVDEALEYTIKKLKTINRDLDIIYYDLTREMIGIPVVRVLITNPIQMLASPLTIVSPRVYSFQKVMGYSDNTPSYEDLYMGIYPH